MEDALVPNYVNNSVTTRRVLILVLMEDALVHVSESITIKLNKDVLILVLMEDALVLLIWVQKKVVFTKSLNPCFNGRCTRTYMQIDF